MAEQIQISSRGREREWECGGVTDQASMALCSGHCKALVHTDATAGVLPDAGL